MNYGFKTHTGPVRKTNEDRVAVSFETVSGNVCVLALVADGMGGLYAGDVASTIAHDTLLAFWRSHYYKLATSKSADSLLLGPVNEANAQIFNTSRHRSKPMGTTLSVLFLHSDRYSIVHVGDTRVYQIRLFSGDTTEPLNGQGNSEFRGIAQLTSDHSWVAEEVLRGELTAEEARVHPKRNILTRCLGAKPYVNVYSTEGKYLNGDCFLLCSDGFYSCFTESEILGMILNSLDAGCTMQKISEKLVNNAIKAGTRDNITVALLGQISEPSTLLTKIARKFFK